MKVLAISGSARKQSTNTALLRALANNAPEGMSLSLFRELHRLPVFSPDLEGNRTPAPVLLFSKRVAEADGVIISSPEYVRAIPGGLKNAIDWLVSREEIVAKPIVLAHASHRGDDMLASLRLVLSTVSSAFADAPFLRIPLMSKAPGEIEAELQSAEYRQQMSAFLRQFVALIEAAPRWT